MRKKPIVATGAALCALVLWAAPVAAYADNPGDDHVDLRTHVAVQMWLPGAATLEVSSTVNAMPSGWNDTVSSLWVWSDVEAITLWENADRWGDFETFIYGTDDLRDYGFNDVTSSYTIIW